MEIKGKIHRILPEVKGEGKNGPWRKQEFVIEQNDEYKKLVCVSTWGDKVDLTKYKQGEPVVAHVNVESREYNNRWYTDIKVWRLEKAGDAAPTVEDEPLMGESFGDIGAAEEDDLPF